MACDALHRRATRSWPKALGNRLYGSLSTLLGISRDLADLGRRHRLRDPTDAAVLDRPVASLRLHDHLHRLARLRRQRDFPGARPDLAARPLPQGLAGQRGHLRRDRGLRLRARAQLHRQPLRAGLGPGPGDPAAVDLSGAHGAVLLRRQLRRAGLHALRGPSGAGLPLRPPGRGAGRGRGDRGAVPAARSGCCSCCRPRRR